MLQMKDEILKVSNMDTHSNFPLCSSVNFTQVNMGQLIKNLLIFMKTSQNRKNFSSAIFHIFLALYNYQVLKPVVLAYLDQPLLPISQINNRWTLFKGVSTEYFTIFGELEIFFIRPAVNGEKDTIVHIQWYFLVLGN